MSFMTDLLNTYVVVLESSPDASGITLGAPGPNEVNGWQLAPSLSTRSYVPARDHAIERYNAGAPTTVSYMAGPERGLAGRFLRSGVVVWWGQLVPDGWDRVRRRFLDVPAGVALDISLRERPEMVRVRGYAALMNPDLSKVLQVCDAAVRFGIGTRVTRFALRSGQYLEISEAR